MHVLKRIALLLLALVALLTVIGFLLPRNVHVERATVIAAPRSTVFALVNSYRQFNKWSPWHDIDPNTQYSYEGPDIGVGAKMSWKADPRTVGSGSQEIVESRAPELVKTSLDFGGQGKATAQFHLAPEGGGTRIAWSMDADMGALPVGRYFGLMMDSIVGKDYERGLQGLKVLAESLPKDDFADINVETVTTAPVTVAYVASKSGRGDREIAMAIGAAYMQVGRFMAANRLKQAGAPITINTKWDDTGYEFDAAIPVDRAPDGGAPADAPVKLKQTYAGKALKVVHTGSYHGLDDTYRKLAAWMAAYGFESGGPVWDEYVSDPGRTAEADLITNIYAPIR
jgi:effector-binding domain-containing protein/uncharacterized protein YndB with AHSA1/START domain